MKKTVKVHILPTQDDSHLSIIRGTRLHYYRKLLNVSPDRVPQHLYFTSDEEIKEGDWYIDDSSVLTTIQQCKTTPSKDLQEEVRCRKIVATTDQRLEYSTTGYTEDRARTFYQKLPQIPQQLLEDYAKANGIDEVYLEYYNITLNSSSISTDRNNYVIIVPNEPKLYTREDLIKLLDKHSRNVLSKAYDDGVLDNNKWAEENLK